MCKILCGHLFSFLLGVYPGVEWLGPRVTPCLTFQGMARWFFKVATPSYLFNAVKIISLITMDSSGSVLSAPSLWSPQGQGSSPRLTGEGQGAGQVHQGDIIAVFLTVGISKGEIAPVVDHGLHPQLQALGGGLGHSAGEHSPSGQDPVPPTREQERRMAAAGAQPVPRRLSPASPADTHSGKQWAAVSTQSPESRDPPQRWAPS